MDICGQRASNLGQGSRLWSGWMKKKNCFGRTKMFWRRESFRKKGRGRFNISLYFKNTWVWSYLFNFFSTSLLLQLEPFLDRRLKIFTHFWLRGFQTLIVFFLDFFETFSIKGRLWRSFVVLFSLSCLCHNNTPSNCIFWRIEKRFLIQTHSIAIMEESAHKNLDWNVAGKMFSTAAIQCEKRNHEWMRNGSKARCIFNECLHVSTFWTPVF